MKTNNILLILIMFLAYSIDLSGQCNNCNTMYSDGITSDDGTPADGVQTSRNCGCGSEIQGACAIIDVNLNGNPYYDPTDPNCGLIVETQESGNFSIYFLSDGCTVNCGSPDFVVSSGTSIDIPGSTFSMMVCKNGGNAGRRDINFSISCSTIENCVNGVDDDLNGFVDCDDPGCNLTPDCSYTQTSTTNDGGLESNNRLAEKINLRNYSRSKLPVDVSGFKDAENLLTRSSSKQRSDLSLSDFVALDALQNSQIYDSSPSDLVDITNASEILGYDIFQQDSRVASVLSIETFEKVYEHTKYICDRLLGSSIDNIWNYNFGTDHNFIITKFSDKDGNAEYNCNFSIIEKPDGTFILESHWNLSSYSNGLKVFNFQIWANHITNLESVVLTTLERIFSETFVSDIQMSGAPELYIKNISYRNGGLDIHVHNASNVKEVKLIGIQTETETSSSEPFAMDIALSGNTEESISIPTGGVYDISFSIQSEDNQIPDVVYVADGAWGMEFEMDGMLIANYEILRNNWLLDGEGKYLVERNILLEGELQGELEVFRSLSPNFRAVDLADMNTLSFQASGKWDMEIVLVSHKIENWEDQPRTSIRLTADKKTYNLSKNIFSSNDDWEAIKMIVFKVKGPKYDMQPLFLTIENVNFSNDMGIITEIPSSELSVSPNPMVEGATLQFDSDSFGTYYFELSDLSGHIIESFSGHSVKGVNTIRLTNNSYRQGMYMARIVNSDGRIYGNKILVL